jgi:hypothetical protein
VTLHFSRSVIVAGTQALTIKEFLLRYAVGTDRSGDDHAGPDALRAEVERHSDRTMTVVTLGGTTTITRCGVCPKGEGRPCTALRLMALPFAQHPAYRQEWRLPQPGVQGDAAQEFPPGTHGGIPRPREEQDFLAPPVAAVRPILRLVAD